MKKSKLHTIEQAGQQVSTNLRGLQILAELIAERYIQEMKERQPKHDSLPDLNNEDISGTY
jgi:hypothetical protein